MLLLRKPPITLTSCYPNKQVFILTGAVFNIMSNFTHNETILINDRDSPWINKKIKGLI